MGQQIGGIVGAGIGSVKGAKGAQIGFAVGSVVGLLLFPDKAAEGPTLGEAPVQTGRDGLVIPMGWGIVSLSGNIIQTNPIQDLTRTERQGKGGGQKVKVPYRLQTFAIGVCRSRFGPIAGIRRIWENDKLVYDTRAIPAIPMVETLAYAENITIYLGTETQLPDPELEGHVGVGECPAYRGLSYIVWNNYDITDFGSAIPQYKFEVLVNTVREVTSRVYPIEASDQLELVVSAPTGHMSPFPADGIEMSPDIGDGFLDLVRYEEGPFDDELIMAPGIGDGFWDTVADSVGPFDNELEMSPDIGDGELRSALVDQDMVPEKMQLGISAPEGSMTPV
jgi:hypothetical protein